MSTELAWAAGFFDGEGCTSIDKRPSKVRWRSPRARISVCQNTREELDRLHSLFEHTVVYGPYSRKPINQKDFYQLVAQGNDRVAAILNKMWPYLCSKKKEQAHRVYGELGKEELLID